MCSKLVIGLFVAQFLLEAKGYSNNPTICLEQGVCYIGSWISETQNSSRRYASFQGIRYAQAPIGSLRFKLPQPYMDSEGVIDVSKKSEIMCPQMSRNHQDELGQEDCLFLNIYVPEKIFEKDYEDQHEMKLPVMVWLYGGSLRIGSNNFDEYGPNEFMKHDIILVTLNYRLGALGFLSMGTNEVPGNAGLRDQNIAMVWVKNNINNFGGNKEMITLAGQSSGSFSVAMHILSPLSKGLFKRAILQSGTTLSPGWGPVTPTHALQYSHLFAQELDCLNNDGGNDILECLQAVNTSDLLRTSIPKLQGNPWYAVPDANFTTDNEPFFPDEAEKLLATGQFNTDLEIIIGTNADEGVQNFFEQIRDPTTWKDYRENFKSFGPMRLFGIANQSEVTEKNVQDMHKLVNYYVGSIENINKEHLQDMIDMFTDCDFLVGTYKTMEYFLEQKMKVYQYILSYEGQYSFSQMQGIKPHGVCHIDDLIYQWDPVLGKLSF